MIYKYIKKVYYTHIVIYIYIFTHLYTQLQFKMHSRLAMGPWTPIEPKAWTENAEKMSLKVQWSTNAQGGNAVPSGELSHFANWKDPPFFLWENPLFRHFPLLC